MCRSLLKHFMYYNDSPPLRRRDAMGDHQMGAFPSSYMRGAYDRLPLEGFRQRQRRVSFNWGGGFHTNENHILHKNTSVSMLIFINTPLSCTYTFDV